MALTVASSSSIGWVASNVVLTKPTGLAVGDLMIASTQSIGAFVSAPSGWSLIKLQNSSGGEVALRVHYKIADASDVADTDFTFQFSGISAGGMVRITGHNPLNPISSNAGDGTPTATNTPSFSVSVTPTKPDSMLIYAVGSYEDTTAQTASGYAVTTSNPSWTEVFDYNFDPGSAYQTSLAWAVRPQTTATGNATVTFAGGGSPADEMAAIMVVVNPAPVLGSFTVTNTSGGTIPMQQASTPFNIKVSALDDDGNAFPSFTGTVDITSTGTLSLGSGTTASFTAGVLASHAVAISNTGSWTITATATGDTENGVSNSFFVYDVVNIARHPGNIFIPVKVLPTLSNVRHVNVIMQKIPNLSTPTQVEARLYFYFNGSPTASLFKEVTREDISKGYKSIEINKQYVNAIQIEVVYTTASNIGVADFSPMYAEVIYEPTTTLR